MIPGSIVTCGNNGFGGPDPYASSVKLYLKMNGSNGSTTFTDSSASARTVTAGGNAQISTAQKLLEGQAGYFDGTGDYLSVADHADMEPGSGNFTYEAFILLDDTTENLRTIYSKGGNFGVLYNAIHFYTIGTVLKASINSSQANGTNELTLASPSGTLVAGKLNHVAFSRVGNAVYLSAGGVIVASGTWSSTVWDSATAGYVGILLSSGAPTLWGFKGYMDCFRYTKGIGRYSSSFDPFVQYWS